MKVIFVTFCCIAYAVGRSPVPLNVIVEGPRCPLPDPLVQDEPFPIDVVFDPVLSLYVGSVARNINFEGLSTYRSNISLNGITLKVYFEFTLEHLSGQAWFNTSGYIDVEPLSFETFPSGNLTGSGLAKFSATNVLIKGHGLLYPSMVGNTLRLRNPYLGTVSFSTLSVDLGDGITIGGETIDWANLSANIKGNFDREWAEHKDELNGKIRGALEFLRFICPPCEGIPIPNPPPCPE